MKTTPRREFIKSASVLGLALPFLNPNEIFGQQIDSFIFHSPFMKVAMRKDFPQLISLCVDSLGKGKEMVNPLLIGESVIKKYKSTVSEKSISYHPESQEEDSDPAWNLSFSDKSIQIISKKTEDSEPFNFTVNQEINHTTVLGVMKERNKVILPCLIHLPDMGTFRVTSNVSGLELFTDARRANSEVKGKLEHNFVSISFPPASDEHPLITYQLDIVSIYPDGTANKNDLIYDGFKRNFINIFQVNPRLRVLANNSSSDSCAFTLYMSAQLAQHTPRLADGLKAIYPLAVVNVIVTAIGGENSVKGAERFAQDVLIHKPDLILIDYGLNDRGCGLEKAYTAWNQMIKLAKDHGIKVILLTPSPDQSVNYADVANELNKHAEQIRRIAAENQVGLADSYQAFEFLYQDKEQLSKYMSQVNHPNQLGHELIANELMKWF
ncbi:MAG: GDSL-type esterase/lipase family protein [Prolixibacteraceae bacterium]|nr:GDSL-type esterase/lipase family protein [Prolixibacteraceae bacterium]